MCFTNAMSLQLDAKLFPRQPSWNACNGSLPHLRGYPCALWMLMHTLTILTLPLHTRAVVDTPTPAASVPTITSTRALVILTNFLKNFFTCEVCRQHFLDLTSDLSPSSLGSDGDAILWLWQAHNLVSTRLAREGGGDPYYPKSLFPSHTRCPYCYHRVSHDQSHVLSHDRQLEADEIQPKFNNTDLTFAVEDGSRRSHWSEVGNAEPWGMHNARGLKVLGTGGHKYEFVWNRTAVLLYLWNFYHLKYYNGDEFGGMESKHRHHQQHRLLLSSILHAAWPSRFRGQGGKEKSRKNDWLGEQSGSLNDGVHILSGILCVIFLTFAAYWLWHKRSFKQRWRKCKRFLLVVLCRRDPYKYY